MSSPKKKQLNNWVEKKKCVRCNKKAEAFSTPWYASKFQILGYCEDCTNAVMGKID